MKRSSIIIIALLGILVLWGVGKYNAMVSENENVNKAWGNVETQYQRRADLIPNLVNTVKGYADFEQETLTKVIEARAKATSTTIDANDLSPENLQQFQANQDALSGALKSLIVTVERYPDLKANQNFLDLQTQLERTENRINTSRIDYNAAANSYNTMVRKFPNTVFAGIFGFDGKPYFEASEGSDQAPEVSF